MNYTTSPLAKIDAINYEDGRVMLDLEIFHEVGASTQLQGSLVETCLQLLKEDDQINKNLFNSYWRLQDHDQNIVDMIILDKINEGLELADKIKREFYKDLSNKGGER